MVNSSLLADYTDLDQIFQHSAEVKFFSIQNQDFQLLGKTIESLV